MSDHLRIYVQDHGHAARRDYCIRHRIGMLYSPHRSYLPQVPDFILDNAAYPAFSRHELLNLDLYREFLRKATGRGSPYFAVIPDIVCGGMASFNFSAENIDLIPKGINRYFVVNPAITEHDLIPYFDEIEGQFISLAAFRRVWDIRRYVVMAHNHDLKAHIGKVGTGKAYTLSATVGADSCDGSTPMRHNDLKRIEVWRKRSREQMDLASINDNREVHYIEKEDLNSAIGAAVYQERSA